MLELRKIHDPISPDYQDLAVVFADPNPGRESIYYILHLDSDGDARQELYSADSPGHVLSVSGGMDPNGVILVEVVEGRSRSIFKEIDKGYFDNGYCPHLAWINGSLQWRVLDLIRTYEKKRGDTNAAQIITS